MSEVSYVCACLTSASSSFRSLELLPMWLPIRLPARLPLSLFAPRLELLVLVVLQIGDGVAGAEVGAATDARAGGTEAAGAETVTPLLAIEK